MIKWAKVQVRTLLRPLRRDCSTYRIYILFQYWCKIVYRHSIKIVEYVWSSYFVDNYESIRWWRSGSDCFEGMKRFVSSFKAQTFFYLLFHEFHVLQKIIVRFDSLSTGHLDDFYTIVATINTSSNAKSTWEQAVLDALSAILEGRSWFT